MCKKYFPPTAVFSKTETILITNNYIYCIIIILEYNKFVVDLYAKKKKIGTTGRKIRSKGHAITPSL